jgi:hypothetical protein
MMPLLRSERGAGLREVLHGLNKQLRYHRPRICEGKPQTDRVLLQWGLRQAQPTRCWLRDPIHVPPK